MAFHQPHTWLVCNEKLPLIDHFISVTLDTHYEIILLKIVDCTLLCTRIHMHVCLIISPFVHFRLLDASEGDSGYIADELLKGRFSTAADIFSLGISLLELACDLELSSGGEGWHSHRNGELPKDFVKGTHLCTDI